MEKGWALVTGASGGMGMELSRALLKAGYPLAMACRCEEKTLQCRRQLLSEIPGAVIDFLPVELSDMDSVQGLAQAFLSKGEPLDLLMNNAGTMEAGRQMTGDGFEKTTSVNYLAPFLLTMKLLKAMRPGSRVVNMVSCTYAVGRLSFPEFFTKGKRGRYARIPVYSNTKLALTLFTLSLAARCREKGICVNAADPGIVSTEIIRMHKWFDPLTDVFFRPLIRKPSQGAATAIRLLLSEECAGVTGQFHASCRPRRLSAKYLAHPQAEELWEETLKALAGWHPEEAFQ